MATTESTTDRIRRLIQERRETVQDILASYDNTVLEVREYKREREMLTLLSISVKQWGYDGLGDEAQFTIDGLIEQEDENLKWS